MNIDITERKKIEEELIKSQEKLIELNATKDKFFSIIAHDLKNPFAGLLSSCELLQRNIVKQDMVKIEKFTNSIQGASKDAYKLLENLLDWSRLQMDKFEVKKEKFNILSLIKTTIANVQNIATEKEIEIQLKSNVNSDAFFDIEMFKTIIRNFITNAIKFSNKDAIVYIEIQDVDEKHFIVSIKDSGVGISENDLPKLFRIDAFHSTSGTNNETGTGLGLILCKDFIEKNGSAIFVESEKDIGSIFSFTVEKFSE